MKMIAHSMVSVIPSKLGRMNNWQLSLIFYTSVDSISTFFSFSPIGCSAHTVSYTYWLILTAQVPHEHPNPH